ncbi:SDR family oxidoreductase [Synechococcus sp. PCC 6312]|uniref:SDR family oxidoreductase n=1 Tax=Synechococcus sp. (strain ATCC 27167 / PCC 6312) TaxID=195253 RepID=UPI00029F08C8|nr:SDR family oxidoreductase [Synechococcus sp. PCC 6312]AFY62500.1 dehydrogenase of unknown specificity, short-chain alcohol dehydrogenase like protein [Synechococcus sp. PCC 6312]
MNRLVDKVALISGAARGIGAAIAEAFIAEGAVVYLTDIQDQLGLETARNLGERAIYCPLDVREASDWQRVTQQILTEQGQLHVVVNNAGITGFEAGLIPHDPENVALEDWRAVHATNLDGVFLGCKFGIKAMRQSQSKGAIINISSRSGLVGIPGAAAYASSKAAVRNHSKTVALYCAEQGLDITCNTILPAAILTPMWEPLLGIGPDRQKRMAALVSDCPLKRFGQPAEVAAVAVLMASDECRYLNGAEITIDGGILAGAVAAPTADK